MQGEIILQHKDGTLTIKPGDRILNPKGEEFSVRWNPVRDCIEFVKTFSDEDGAITINPATSNHIYIS